MWPFKDPVCDDLLALLNFSRNWLAGYSYQCFSNGYESVHYRSRQTVILVDELF
jgi:hypothetical protein